MATITTGDELKDQAKQSSLDYLRESIDVLFSNQTEDPNSIVNDTILDITPDEVDTFIRQLVNEHDLPIERTRLSFEEVKDAKFYGILCDYVQVNNVSLFNSSYVHFLESSNFAITIISIDLADGTTRLRIEPLDMSPKFLKDEWKRILDKDKKNINPRNIPGIISGKALLNKSQNRVKWIH